MATGSTDALVTNRIVEEGESDRLVRFKSVSRIIGYCCSGVSAMLAGFLAEISYLFVFISTIITTSGTLACVYMMREPGRGNPKLYYAVAIFSEMSLLPTVLTLYWKSIGFSLTDIGLLLSIGAVSVREKPICCQKSVMIEEASVRLEKKEAAYDSLIRRLISSFFICSPSSAR